MNHWPLQVRIQEPKIAFINRIAINDEIFIFSCHGMGFTKGYYRQIADAFGTHENEHSMSSICSKIYLFFQTTLCNTALDNPNKITKTDVANYLLTYLPTDSILYHSSVSICYYISGLVSMIFFKFFK